MYIGFARIFAEIGYLCLDVETHCISSDTAYSFIILMEMIASAIGTRFVTLCL
jgi:hypothetical protein